MEKSYWLKGWESGWRKNNQADIHQPSVNADLENYYDLLNLKKHDRILVPLCGKTQDMIWLKQKGIQVVGIELSTIACEGFFSENGLIYLTNTQENFTRYKSESIELFCGDIFDLTQNDVPYFNAIYDRLALSALPAEMRKRYADQLVFLSCRGTRILLVVSEIENHSDGNPPFSITYSEINRIFEKYFSVVLIKKEPVVEIPLSLLKRGYKKISSTIYLLERIQG